MQKQRKQRSCISIRIRAGIAVLALAAVFAAALESDLLVAEGQGEDSSKSIVAGSLTTEINNPCVGRGLYEDFDVWRRFQFVAAYFSNPELEKRARVLDTKYAVPVTTKIGELKETPEEIIRDAVLVSLDRDSETPHRFTMVKLPCVLSMMDQKGTIRTMEVGDIASLLEARPEELSNIKQFTERAYVLAGKGSDLERERILDTESVVAWNPDREVSFLD